MATKTKTGVLVTGVWLRREGTDAVVLVERDGRWIEIIRELDVDQPPFSHITEPAGILRQEQIAKGVPVLWAKETTHGT